jgi:flagellar L-ring protein FlgH
MKTLLITLLAGSFLAALCAPVQAQHSLYRDVKAHKIGDIITVILTENISGSSTRDSRETANTAGSVSGSTSGNLSGFRPFFSADAAVSYDNDARSLANQRQLLSGYLSVQIVGVGPSGDLLVEGKRLTEINGEMHEVSLKGVVRLNDIDSRNQVLSYRVANAEISYLRKGGIKQASRRPGVGRRLFMYVGVLAISGAILVRELLL